MARVPRHAWGSQRTTCWSCLSLLTRWILGIKFRPSGSEASIFTRLSHFVIPTGNFFTLKNMLCLWNICRESRAWQLSLRLTRHMCHMSGISTLQCAATEVKHFKVSVSRCVWVCACGGQRAISGLTGWDRVSDRTWSPPIRQDCLASKFLFFHFPLSALGLQVLTSTPRFFWGAGQGTHFLMLGQQALYWESLVPSRWLVFCTLYKHIILSVSKMPFGPLFHEVGRCAYFTDRKLGWEDRCCRVCPVAKDDGLEAISSSWTWDC